jgi:co-chaperonin GroES (HSP10)
MQALGKNIIVRKESAPERIGLIYVPMGSDDETSPPYVGEVISAGPAVTDPEIEPGARVAFNDLAGSPFEHDGVRYLLLSEKNVAAVLKKDLRLD